MSLLLIAFSPFRVWILVLRQIIYKRTSLTAGKALSSKGWMAFSGTHSLLIHIHSTRKEIVYSKLHFTYHTWKVYLSPWNFELRVNLFDSLSLISSTYHWFIDAKRHWKYNAVILMTSYFVEHNAVKIIFFSQIGNFPCIVFPCRVTTR